MTADIDKMALALRVAEKLDRMDVASVIKPPLLVRSNDEAQAIASVLREYAGGGWSPIDTAPKDRSDLLLWAGGRAVTGHWSDEEYAKRPRPLWVSSLGTYGNLGVSWDRANQPTFWMPLPTPPTETAK